MGSDDDSLRRESTFEHRVEKGKHGTVVQTGPVDEVNVTSREPRPQTLQNVLVSVTILTVLAVGVSVVIVSSGLWPAGSRRSHDGSARPAPSSSPPAGSATPSAPAPPPRAPEESAADGNAPDSHKKEPSAASPSSGESGSSTGSRRNFPNHKTTELGGEITKAQATACGEFELCAYRTPDHRTRFDFAAPGSDAADWNTCYSLPSGDPGFASVVNGRGYNYYLYEKPGCEGGVHVLNSYKGFQDWDGFTFRSYAKT